MTGAAFVIKPTNFLPGINAERSAILTQIGF
jgi:hypothetical protein